MSEPVYITKIAKRERQYPGGITLELPYGKEYDWFRQQYKKTGFTIPKLRSRGAELFYKLCQAIKTRDECNVSKLLPELEGHCTKHHDEKTDMEKWSDMAVQLPGDWGPHGENKKKLKGIITKKAYGRVLEAMCGFNSYFGKSDEITEVAALDFCEEALKCYEYSQRNRILYDLERVVNAEKIDFFEDSSFQTMGVFFGIDYLTDVVSVYREFYRILSNDGKLLVVDGTTQGYRDMLKRMFNPEDCFNSMKSAGFSAKIEHLPLKTEFETGEYYIVEGKKR